MFSEFSSELQRDEFFMHFALKEAKKAYENMEVPVGAILVKDNRIIAKGYNQVEMLKDATAHAEVLCLSGASGSLGNWRLENTELYCTLEPCMMCAGAMFNSRIKRLIWSAEDVRIGANGSYCNLFENIHPFHQIEVTKHILKDESSLLMKNFFKKVRERNESDRKTL